MHDNRSWTGAASHAALQKSKRDGVPDEGWRRGATCVVEAGADKGVPAQALPGNLEQQVEDILKEVDTNRDGSIDYDEFAAMMRGMQSSQVKETAAIYRKGALI